MNGVFELNVNDVNKNAVLCMNWASIPVLYHNFDKYARAFGEMSKVLGKQVGVL